MFSMPLVAIVTFNEAFISVCENGVSRGKKCSPKLEVQQYSAFERKYYIWSKFPNGVLQPINLIYQSRYCPVHFVIFRLSPIVVVYRSDAVWLILSVVIVVFAYTV